MQYFGKFHEAKPDAIKPAGHLKEQLSRQNNGIGSHYAEQGYPFDTPMWNGGVGRIELASVICHDESGETPMQEAWWPYEQSAYLLDGLLRLGILLDDPAKKELFRKNLRYMMSHPAEDGTLGHCYNESPSEWPMAVFFRAVNAWYELTGDKKVQEAMLRHFTSITPEKLALGFRHINNLEGLLKTYEWTGDASLLIKALEAYQLHDRRNTIRTDDEFELHWSKITSGHNYVIHGVSFCESVKLPVILYLYTGDEKWLKGAEKGLQEVLARHEQIPGLPSSNEDFAGRDPLQGYETCVITDFTWTLGYFLMATGKAEYADRIEKIIYNALPGSVLPDFTALQYMSAPNQVIATDYSNHSFFFRGAAGFRQFSPTHSAQCCPGNLHRALPNFVLRQWMMDSDGIPSAVLYGPSVFTGEYNGKMYRLEEITDYPYSETVTIRVKTTAASLPVVLRIPGWCDAASVRINGKTCKSSAESGTFLKLPTVHDGDEIVLTLPMKVVQKQDRYWSWYEYGPLVFTYPVAYREEREKETFLSARNLYPVGKWNYGVKRNTPAKVERNGNDIVLKIRAYPASGYDALESGRYTPEVPMFSQAVGEAEELTLIPYGKALLRITAFPDLETRTVLPVYQVLCSAPYPYDFRKPLEEQCYLPEDLPEKELLASCQEMQMDRSGYYDLIHHFGPLKNVLSYMIFRVWAEDAGDVVFAVSASDGAECYVNGEKRYTIEPPFDGEFMAPVCFTAPVRKGYNVLMLKVCEGFTPLQYRKAWGARVTVYKEGTHA